MIGVVQLGYLARSTLTSVVLTLVPASLGPVLTVLCKSLTNGYRRHVLSFVVQAILDTLVARTRHRLATVPSGSCRRAASARCLHHRRGRWRQGGGAL